MSWKGGVLLNRRMLIASTAGTALAPAATSAAMPGAPTRPRILPAQRQWRSPPPHAPAREGLAELPGIRLWYSDTEGPGEPIVLLHPSTGSAHVWAYQQSAFVQAGYRVIAYSRRGHAGSESGSADTPGTAVDDLDNLLDFLKVQRVHLLGSGAGGFIVPDYALSYADRLLSMTIACSQGGVTAPAFRETIARITAQPFGQLPANFRELGPSYRAAAPEGVAEWETLERGAVTGPHTQAPKNRLLWEDVARIRTPTLMLAGAADLYMPVPLMLEYAGHLSNVETGVLSESGHSGYWEQPEAFNALVLDFLRRHPAR